MRETSSIYVQSSAVPVLLNLDADSEPWSDEDLGAMLAHQMLAPLVVDLGGEGWAGESVAGQGGANAAEVAEPSGVPQHGASGRRAGGPRSGDALAGGGGAAAEGAAASPALRSFGDLFAAATPPIELLELTKHFAKRHARRVGLPPDIARVLYYLAIGAAHTRLHRRISSLTPEELRAGVRWALSQPWLDAGTRTQFERIDASLPTQD